MLRPTIAHARIAAGLFLGLCTSACTDKKTSCPEQQRMCGDVCATVATDRAHCGECGRTCEAGEVCSAGICVVSCPLPARSCGGACADLDADPQHCGACDRACGEGKVCVNGACNESCPAGLTACDGRCVDLQSDPRHCGACGTSCEAGDACEHGACAGCLTGSMARTLPASVAADLEPTRSRHELACGFEKAAGTPDVSYAFTAPSRGVYEVDSEGSEVDVLLGVLDGTCGGRTLACADSSEANAQRSLRVGLEAGETIVVVAESKVVAAGKVRLRMRQVEKQAPAGDTCAPIVLGSEIPRTVVGDSSEGADNLSAKCGAEGSREQLYQFTAPATGRYQFDTYGSNFDTVLSVLTGGCEGEQIACNDDAADTSGSASELRVKLVEGQTVLLLVEGVRESGKFTLHASASSLGDLDPCCFDSPVGGCGNETVEACVCATDSYCCAAEWDLLCAQLAQTQCALSCKPMASECQVTDLGSAAPQTVTGTTLGALNVLVPSCSADGSPERLYRFEAPEAGSYAFDTKGSKFDTVVYVLRGACNGEEIACNDDYETDPPSRANVTLAAHEVVVVAVDGYGGAADDFTLNVLRVDGGATGNCCAPHEGTGCSVDTIQTCVCNFDPYCCDPDNGWDDICVGAAAIECQVCE